MASKVSIASIPKFYLEYVKIIIHSKPAQTELEEEVINLRVQCANLERELQYEVCIIMLVLLF